MQSAMVQTSQFASQTGWWSVIPSILWVVVGTIALVTFREEVRGLFKNFSWRLRSGAALKVFSIELPQTYVSQSIDTAKNETALEHRADENEERWRQRESYYKPNRNIHLVHRLAPSEKPRMLNDIQLYVIAHKDATLANLSRVEYYFGRQWGNQVFTSIDRSQGFPITTSAHGTFMCTAKLCFSDGETVMINRYVDFEMGAIGNNEMGEIVTKM